MKRVVLVQVLLIVGSFNLIAQNIGPDEELYFKSPPFHGEQVKLLQRFLLYRGWDIGPDGIDGYFGRDTENALKAMQGQSGQEMTGRIRISDIPESFNWEPHFETRLNSDARPYRDGFIPVPNQFGMGTFTPNRITLDGYYGHLDMVTNNEHDEFFYEIYHSPNKRYIASRWYSPYGDTAAGIPLYVYDVLSQQGDFFYAFIELGLELYTEESYGAGFSDYYWTETNELYVDITDNDGNTHQFRVDVSGL